MEIWKEAVGYEGIYSVSNYGKIRRDKASRGTRVGKILNYNLHKKTKYYTVMLYKLKISKRISVHTLVANAFIGKCPRGYDVNHIDGIKLNNNSSNLEYVTRKENIRHSVKIGTFRTGANHQNSKLSEEERNLIKKKYAENNIKYSELANEYNACVVTIRRIINGRR